MRIDDLGMTERQAVEEILTMREFSNFLEDRMGDKYHEYVNAFARQKAETLLASLGASSEDVKEICDKVDKLC